MKLNYCIIIASKIANLILFKFEVTVKHTSNHITFFRHGTVDNINNINNTDFLFISKKKLNFKK